MPKVLYVMRHAKSDWGEPGLADIDRGLKKRGKRAAKTMGRWALDEACVPDLVICSPARRARMTAKRFCAACEYDGEMIYQDVLYGGGVAAYLGSASNLGQDAESVMLIGHNPTCEEIALDLTGRLTHVTTANILGFKLPIDDWRQLAENACRGVLSFHVRPHDVSDDY